MPGRPNARLETRRPTPEFETAQVPPSPLDCCLRPPTPPSDRAASPTRPRPPPQKNLGVAPKQDPQAPKPVLSTLFSPSFRRFPFSPLSDPFSPAPIAYPPDFSPPVPPVFRGIASSSSGAGIRPKE